PERDAGDAAPRPTHAPLEPGHLALAVDEIAGDRAALGIAERPRVLHEEVAGQVGRHVRVVHQPEMVLQGGDTRDQAVRLRAERLAQELERVAQAPAPPPALAPGAPRPTPSV